MTTIVYVRKSKTYENEIQRIVLLQKMIDKLYSILLFKNTCILLQRRSSKNYGIYTNHFISLYFILFYFTSSLTIFCFYFFHFQYLKVVDHMLTPFLIVLHLIKNKLLSLLKHLKIFVQPI